MGENRKSTNSIYQVVAAGAMVAVLGVVIPFIININSDVALLTSRYEERTATAIEALRKLEAEQARARNSRSANRETIAKLSTGLKGIIGLEDEMLKSIKIEQTLQSKVMELENKIETVMTLMKEHMLPPDQHHDHDRSELGESGKREGRGKGEAKAEIGEFRTK